MELAQKAKEALLAKKGQEVVLLDVRGISTVADYFLIATGTSAPHIKALFQETQKVLKSAGVSCFRKSGTPESEWVVADYIDTVVHIFSPGTRGYYALEQLWGDAKKVT